MAQPKARVSIDKLEVVESVPLADLEVEETAPATEAAAPSGGFASDFAARSGQVPVVGPAVQKYLDVNIGAAKSAGQLVVGAGRAVQMVPGVSKAVDTLYGSPGISARAMNEADAYLKPTNATQTVAKAGADMAQFFLPVPGGSKARAAVAAKDAGLTYLQTGSIPAAAASAGLSAVLPGANAVANAAGRLKIGAEKTVAQALGATKEWAKTEATKLAPQILQRGIKGTREGMLAQATAQAKAVGKSLDDAYDVGRGADHQRRERTDGHQHGYRWLPCRDIGREAHPDCRQRSGRSETPGLGYLRRQARPRHPHQASPHDPPSVG
jgi:hypothetical protein